MKYYAIITNSLGEQVLFAQADSRPEIEAEIAPLVSAGFPSHRFSIIKAGGLKDPFAKACIVFVDNNGEVMEYPIHSTDIRREFLIAAEMICRRQLKRIVAAELRDNLNHSLCRVELGDIMVPDGRQGIQFNTLERYSDSIVFKVV